MNGTGIRSLMGIFQKNSEMQLPEKTVYRVLATIALLGIMIPCTAVVGFISYVMTEALIEAGNPGGGMLFEMQILSAFSMVFGIMVIFSVLFFSSDREHFVTLPIPSHHLMMAKFLYAYLAESVMEFLILAAVLVGYLLAVGINIGLGAALHPVSLVASVLGVILIPLVPMIYCALFSLILMAALSGVKNERVFYRMSTVFLLIFAALFVYSLRGLGEINIDNYVESLGSGDNLFLRTLNVIFFPVVWLSEAVSGGSISYLLLYLAANAGLMVILYGVGKVLYQKGLYTAAALGSSKKAGIREKDLREQSPFRASLIKELRVILRTKAFSSNTAYINVIWPLGAFLLFHFMGNKGAIAAFIAMYRLGKPRAEMILIMLVVSIAFIATSLNSLASSAFTREGLHLDLVKFIPVSYKTQMYAKATVSLIFTYPMLVLTNIIICAYVGVSVFRGVIFAILMLFAHIISIVIGMLLDSAAPYTVWSDEYSALRGNLNVFFNMAVMMVISLIVIGIGLLLYELLGLPISVYYGVEFVILGGIAIRLVVVESKRIVANMERMNS